MAKFNLGIVSLILVTLVLYVFHIDLSLFYQAQQPLFYSTFNELIHSLAEPEGFSIYVGEFLTEKLYYRNLGSVLIVVFQTLFILPFFFVFRKKISLKLIAINMVWIFSFLLFTSYSLRIESVVRLLISLWIAYSWVIIISKFKNKALNLLVMLCLLVLNYWLGGGTSLLFGGILISTTVLSHKLAIRFKLLHVIASLLLCLSLPLIAIYTQIQVVPLKAAYLGSFAANSRYSIPLAYYLFVVVLIALFSVSLWDRLNVSWNTRINSSLSFLGIAILVVCAFAFIDDDNKNRLALERMAEQGDWNNYLSIVAEDESPRIIESFNTNRALFHLDLLLSDGNQVAQYYGDKGLFIEHQMRREHLLLTSDLYWEMGYINESRHWAHEAFTSFGIQPRILMRLVEVNIVLGKYNTANKYIVLLKKSTLHREWAEKKETYLYNPEKCIASKLYANKILGLPFHNFTANTSTGLSGLINLIEHSNENKMVIEYLTMMYLLQHDLAHVIELIPTYRKHNYKDLPKMVQQGLLVYMVKTRKNPDLMGYVISQDEIAKFNAYTQLFSAYRQGDSQAKSKIIEKYSGTFWYYIHFVSTVNKKNKK